MQQRKISSFEDNGEAQVKVEDFFDAFLHLFQRLNASHPDYAVNQQKILCNGNLNPNLKVKDQLFDLINNIVV